MACLSEDDVSAFAEGTLDAEALATIDSHLATCAKCCALIAIARAAENETGDAPTSAATTPRYLARGTSFGRYAIVGPLGRGGMGIVYRARDTKLDREVALKIVATGVDADPRAMDRLLREARAAAALPHPGVVKIFEAAIHEGTAYIAMELVVGTTLRQAMNQAANETAKIGWIVALAGVLAHAHARGIIHRDIKPENVMIREDGSLAVLDFGLARRPSGALVASDAPRLSTLTAEGMLVGTPAYMPPEQLLGERVDARADQFAWGAVAYELLAGRRAWEGRGAADLFDRMMGEVPAPLSESVPEPLRRAIFRALRVKAEERFASMDDVLAMLIPLRLSDIERSNRSFLTQLRGWSIGLAALALTFCVVYAVRLGVRHRPIARSPDANQTTDATQLSSNAEALGEYRLGLQAVKDAALATTHFERATEIDPWFAGAHLRCVTNLAPVDHDSIVTHYHAARRSRSTLGRHDQVLLDAYEPITHDAADAREAAKRIESALRDAPGDPDYLLSLCRLRFFAGAYDAATEACDMAAKADDTLAYAYWMKGLSRIFADDLIGADQAYERCLAVSPAAALCISDRLNLRANEGLCTAAVVDARQLIALDPQNPQSYVYLANVLAGAGAPTEASELALEQRWQRLDARQRIFVEPRDRADLAIYEGDYGAAQAWFAKREKALLDVRDEWEHLALFREQAMLALETGHDAEASALADAFLTKRNAGWNAPEGIDTSMVAWGIQYRAGTMARTELENRRARWLAVELARPTVGEQGRSRGALWVMAYAEPAKTAEDGAEALRALPAYLPLPDAFTRSPDFDEPIGRAYLLAHTMPEALIYLQRAARACTPIFFVMYELDAKRELAEAQTRSGDLAGACASYAAIRAQWGRMKGARSAALAQKQAALLGCP